MKIFKELKKIGYKHYTDNTIEELDNLPLDSEERIMEQSLVFRWFRKKHGLYHYITTHDSTDFEWYVYDKDQNDWEDDTTQNTPEEAELACLSKLVEIVKNKENVKQTII